MMARLGRIRISKALVAVVLVAVGFGAQTGCSSDAGGSLDGTNWKLTGWTLNSLNPADFTITAGFAAGKISGNSGVNSYSGPYAAGSDGSFSIGPLASTAMGGPEPAMRAESAYVTLLGQAASYKVSGSVLTLYDANGNESLIFGTTAGP